MMIGPEPRMRMDSRSVRLGTVVNLGCQDRRGEKPWQTRRYPLPHPAGDGKGDPSVWVFRTGNGGRESGGWQGDPRITRSCALRGRRKKGTLYSGNGQEICLLYTSPSPRDGLLSR